MKNFFKKYNIWINVAVFLVVVFAAVFFVISPLIADMETKSDDIQKKIIDDSLNSARVSKIPQMQEIETSFSENKDNLNILLSNDNEVEFIKKIESLADETGNKVDLKIEDDAQNQKTQAPAAKKDPADILSNLPYGKYLRMQINLTGDYGQALNFIHKLENMNYYVNVISLGMVKGTSQPDTNNPNGAGPNPFSVNTNSNNNANANTNINNAPPQEVPVLNSSLEVVVYLSS